MHTPDCNELDLENEGIPACTNPYLNDPTNNCNEDEGIISLFIDTLVLLKDLFKTLWKNGVNGTLEWFIELLTTKSHEITCVILENFPGCEERPEKDAESP